VSEFTVECTSVTFWLRLKPRSRRQRLGRNSAGELVLEILAPPVEGKANQAAIRFLAEALDVPRSAVEIVAGEKSRRKLLRIVGSSAPGTLARLHALALKGEK
jgi:uncharacterized protein